MWKITILRQIIIFFSIAEGGARIFGVFHVKNHDFTPKNHLFSILGGGEPGAVPPLPPRSAPAYLFPKNFKLFGFPICGLRVFPTKVILETWRNNWIRYIYAFKTMFYWSEKINFIHCLCKRFCLLYASI